MGKLDLNALQDVIHENERNGDEFPADKKKKVFVDATGEMKIGNDVSDRSARTMSEVPQSTFADRQVEEARIVRAKMPSNAKQMTTREGTKGWLWRVKCAYGKPYDLFGWYDGAFYQVLVVSPEIETKWRNPHTGHLFSDGRICLGDRHNSGERSLEAAYAKSTLWATGMTVALTTGRFPFNHYQ